MPVVKNGHTLTPEKDGRKKKIYVYNNVAAGCRILI